MKTMKTIWNVIITNSKEDFVMSKRVNANNKEEVIDWVKAKSLECASKDFTKVKSVKFGVNNEENCYSSVIDFENYRMQIAAFKDEAEEAPEKLQCLAFGDNDSLRIVATFADANDMGEELYSAYVGGAVFNEGRMDIRVADAYKFVTVGNTVLLLEEA